MFDRSKKYYKIFNEADLHYGFQYKDGMNIDTVPFNNDPKKSCVKGGLYFTDSEHICEFLDIGDYIREVEIPDDANVIHYGNKWRSDKLFLHERKDLRNVETWQWMVEQGINVNVDYESGLFYASENGHIDIVRFLIESGANTNVFTEGELNTVAEYGYFDICKVLIDNGANINADNDYLLETAYEHENIDFIKYLIENGADISKVNIIYLLELSKQHNDIELTELIFEKINDFRIKPQYKKPSVTVDTCIVSDIDNEKSILLIKRKNDPYKDCWAIPGGFLDLNETLFEAAKRELKEETHLDVDNLTELGTYSAVNRDPRDRVISVAYYSIVNYNDVKDSIMADDDASDYKWFSFNNLPKLAFDHDIILNDLIERIQSI